MWYCGIDAMEKKFECKYERCNYASNKKANLKRHAKESEDTVMNVSDSESEKVDSNDEWEEQDPGDLLGPITSSEEEEGVDEEKNEEVEVNDMINHETVKLKPSTSQIEVGRIIRKPTYPQKVLAPKRAHVPESDENEPPRKIGPKDLRNVIPKPVIPKRVVK
jgi:LPS O-antigen subunit length determinant protein (WzzB/FepE family)